MAQWILSWNTSKKKEKRKRTKDKTTSQRVCEAGISSISCYSEHFPWAEWAEYFDYEFTEYIIVTSYCFSVDVLSYLGGKAWQSCEDRLSSNMSGQIQDLSGTQ